MPITEITVREDDCLMITVPGAHGKTCVYVEHEDGKLVFTGGANIVKAIRGGGMAKKIEKS